MPGTDLLSQLELTADDVVDTKFYRGRGCAACNNTGFKGRTGLFEYMPISERVRELINKGASTEQLRDVAMQTGMRPLRLSGIDKLQRGITSIDEVIRETVADI